MGDVFGMNEAISQANSMTSGVLDHNTHVDEFKKKLRDGLKQKQDELATTLKEHAGEYGLETAYYTMDGLRRTYEVGKDIQKAGLRGYMGQQAAIGKQRLNLLVGRKAESVADLTAKARPVAGSQPRPRRNAMMGEEGRPVAGSQPRPRRGALGGEVEGEEALPTRRRRPTSDLEVGDDARPVTDAGPEDFRPDPANANFQEPPSQSVPSAGDASEEPHRFTGSAPAEGSIPSQVGREASESAGLEGMQATYRSTGTLGGKTLNNTIKIGQIGEADLGRGVPGSFAEALSKAQNMNTQNIRGQAATPESSVKKRRGALGGEVEGDSRAGYTIKEENPFSQHANADFDAGDISKTYNTATREADLARPETLQSINQRYDARAAQGGAQRTGEGSLFEGQEQPDFGESFKPEAAVRAEAPTYSRAADLPDFVRNTLNRPTRGLDKTTQDIGERLRGQAEGSAATRGSVATTAERQQATQSAQDIADRYARMATGTSEGLDTSGLGAPTRLPSDLPEPMPIRQEQPNLFGEGGTAETDFERFEEPDFSVPDAPRPTATPAPEPLPTEGVAQELGRGTKREAGELSEAAARYGKSATRFIQTPYGVAAGQGLGSTSVPAATFSETIPPVRPQAAAAPEPAAREPAAPAPEPAAPAREPAAPEPAAPEPAAPEPRSATTSTSTGTDAPSRPETTTQGTQSLEPATSSETGGGIKGGIKSGVDEESSKFGEYAAKANKYFGYLGSAAGIAEGGYDMYQDFAPSGKNDGKTMFEDMDGLQKASNVLGDIAGVGEAAALFVPGVGAIAGLAGAASVGLGGIDTIEKDIDAPKKAADEVFKQEQTQHDVSAPRLAQQGLVATVQSDNRDTIKPTSTSF